LFAMFLGAVVAVVVGYIEADVLDPCRAHRLGLTWTEFEHQWHRYS
jgi:hypothetical protein